MNIFPNQRRVAVNKVLIILTFLLLMLLFLFKIEPFSVNIETDKIDAVYTWVDGDDPNWKLKKTKYTGEAKEDSIGRYKSIDELKYSLRSLYKYAPWINKIYIVVDDNQIPSFINEKCDKIKIIKHSDIIPQNYLPLFNSVAIEANIHHIPGLSENFLYFNDDMFLGDYISKKDIFNICYYDNNTPFSELTADDEEWICNLKNNYLMLKDKFPNSKFIVPSHQVHFCKKSLMYEIEKILPVEYKFTSSQKLRKQTNDKACQSFVLPKMQYNLGISKGIYKTILENSCIYIGYGDNNTLVTEQLNHIKSGKIKFFCINDNSSNLIINFLNEYYNFKCPYEL